MEVRVQPSRAGRGSSITKGLRVVIVASLPGTVMGASSGIWQVVLVSWGESGTGEVVHSRGRTTLPVAVMLRLFWRSCG